MIIIEENRLTDIEIAVLKVMHTRLVYGKHHKRLETIMKSGFRSDKYNEVKKAINSLIKKGYILWAKKSKKAIQLNKRYYNEIEKIVRT